jgi:hypothetical protein
MDVDMADQKDSCPYKGSNSVHEARSQSFQSVCYSDSHEETALNLDYNTETESRDSSVTISVWAGRSKIGGSVPGEDRDPSLYPNRL